MHRFMQAFQLCSILKSSYPDVEVVLFLAHEASDYHHAFRDLKRNDDLLDVVYPLLCFPWRCPGLPQLKEQRDLLIYEIGV